MSGSHRFETRSIGVLVVGLWMCFAVGAYAVTQEDCAALAEQHGLAVADEAAGVHGRQGRNTAKGKQIFPTIESATWIPAAGSVPEYCRVEGFITTGDKKIGFNQVRFAVNLPTAWNHRFVMLGDGGHDGSVSTSTARLDEGYATANSDMGHDRSVFPGSSFASDILNPDGYQQMQIDYGYNATHVTTVAAKGIIQSYYGWSPAYSYWEGCSTGGRQAAVEAQRFPGDFDGIVGGALFNNAIGTAMEQNWSSNNFMRNVDGDGVGFDNNITQVDINALKAAVLDKCDVLGNDKIQDNVVDNPLRCAEEFTNADIDALGVAQSLSAGQIQAIKDVYAGPHNSTNTQQWYKGKALGTEYAWGLFVVPTPANGRRPFQTGFAFTIMNDLWFEHDPGLPTADPGNPTLLPGPGEYRWLDFDFDANTPTGPTTNPGTGPWDPNDGGGFMRAMLNGSETDLTDFLIDYNGKYLLYHGWGDPLIGAEPTVDYYKGIVQDTFGGNAAVAQQNVRLHMVPGMGHCAGGVSGVAHRWDKLAPLVEWVENGNPPEAIVVTDTTNERIICPWPLQPTYTGIGDANDSANWIATNFACQAQQ